MFPHKLRRNAAIVDNGRGPTGYAPLVRPIDASRRLGVTVPFIDAELPEVCGRVALQLVKRQWRLSGEAKPKPTACVRQAIDALPYNSFPIVQTALIGLQYALITKKLDTKTWLARCVAASRLGYGFRRCFYDDYKATRRR